MKTWDFPSSSSSKTYTVQVNPTTGLLSCNCLGWVTKKLNKPRWCRHCEKVKNDEGLTLEERDGQMFVMSAGSTAGTQKAVKPANSTNPGAQADGNTQIVTPPPGFVTPMLASVMPEGRTADSFNSDWIMEEKFDGHRIIMRVEHIKDAPSRSRTKIQAWSRLGNTRTLPVHIVQLVAEMPVGVYDGELIVPSAQHSYSVTAGQNSGNEALVLFDMLEVDGRSIMGVEQHVRRAFLEIAYSAIDAHPSVISITSQWRPSQVAVQKIWNAGGEGAIIKRLSGKYNPGWRSPDWIKVKKVASAVLTIVGFTAGKNGPYSIIKLRGDDGIETTVKTLDNNMMRQFAANPNSYIGKRLVVSYQEKTPSGKLRHIMADHLAGVGE